MCSPTALLDRELKRDGFSGVHRDRGEGPMLAESVWLEVERLAGEIPAHHDLGVAATIRAHSHDHKHERSLYRLLGMPADVGSHGGVLAEGERGERNEDESREELSQEHTSKITPSDMEICEPANTVCVECAVGLGDPLAH
jgi:hypothetical protein